MQGTGAALSLMIGGAIFAGINGASDLFLGPERFMEVGSVEYSNGIVSAERIIHVDRIVADWRVTIVGVEQDAPLCQTVPGAALHHGWSIYRGNDPIHTEMSLDDWVGDSGCADRLENGEHMMFITWTPRDGSEPVSTITTFERNTNG
jgi:hypothetical protein